MKRLCYIIAAVTALLYCTYGAGAASFGAELNAEGDIRPGRSFDVTLTLKADENIAAFDGILCYDKSLLELKKLTVDDKTDKDVISYNDDGGSIHFVVGCSENRKSSKTLRFRFAPYNSEGREYGFSVISCSCCDIGTRPRSITDLPVLSLSVSESGTESSSRVVHRDPVSSDTEGDQSRYQSREQSREQSRRSSGVTSGGNASSPAGRASDNGGASESGVSDFSDTSAAEENNASDTGSEGGGRVYSLPDTSGSDSGSVSSVVLAFAAGVGVAGVGLGAYFIGKRSRK